MTFGQITHRDGHWHIKCEAHVRTKLKRLFPEVSQRAGEVISLSDNDENCRDLLWFIDRYPMNVDGMRRLRKGSASHVEKESMVAAL
ncbi:MAG TPA: ATP-dependent helicase, partial [Noviherbaspirillum sp.]